MHTQGSWVFAISPACIWRRRIADIWGTLRIAFIPPGFERSCMTNNNATLELSRATGLVGSIQAVAIELSQWLRGRYPLGNLKGWCLQPCERHAQNDSGFEIRRLVLRR